jgi:hypothetical protein
MNGLAVELIDAIIDHVDEKDDISRSHLLTCSLVCRLWLPSSQRRLFRHIKFPIRSYSEMWADVQRLDQALINSPHLASCIRVLELPKMLSHHCSTHQRRPPGWIGIAKSLSTLFPKLTLVQKLKISYLTWNDMPGYFRQSLCRLLELPSMAFVYIYCAEFSNMDDLTNFINHARGPISLSLDFSTSHQPLETKQGEDNNQRSEPLHISHLNRLDMRCNNNSVFVNWLLAPRSHFGVSHIHTLHISVPMIEYGSVNRLLRAIGSSLKHVSIAVPRTCE